MKIGYALSGEEHRADDLVRNARAAEDAGFDFAMISDHFHPWIDRQGQSPFVWSVLGAIARETKHLTVGTGVTCPLIRMHPAIVAHAAATIATMMPGRFMLGLGTGENLNEHVVDQGWPAATTRVEMLAEAILCIRLLWSGEEVSREGNYYSLRDARIYTLPHEPPPILVAAKSADSAATAAKLGDGLVGVGPDPDPVRAFDEAGGRGKPKYGQIHVCWANSKDEAVRTTREIWPNSAWSGALSQEIARPRDFEAVASLVREEDIAKSGTYGPDPDEHVEAIKAMADAGYNHVYVHQIGPDQEGFIRFYEREVLPRVRRARASA